MRDLEATLHHAFVYLAAIGWAGEALDLSVKCLGPAPQSRSREKRVKLLAEYRLFMLDHEFHLDAIAHFDR